MRELTYPSFTNIREFIELLTLSSAKSDRYVNIFPLYTVVDTRDFYVLRRIHALA